MDDSGRQERELWLVDIIQIKHWCFLTSMRLCILLASITMYINVYKSN